MMSALLFSHQRSGSSNLTRFIGDAAQISAGLEVFNRKTLQKHLPNWTHCSYQELDAHITQALTRMPVIKHIYGKHSSDIDALLAQNKAIERILLLYRENAEAAALSYLIARRLDHFQGVARDSIGSIPPRKLKQVAARLRRNTEYARTIAQRTRKPLRELTYEQVFECEPSRRKYVARDVLSYMTNREIDDRRFDIAFERFILPSKKTNSPETYSHIDNIGELVDHFPGLKPVIQADTFPKR